MQIDLNKKAAYTIAVVIIAVALYLTSLKSYVLFHSMVELFSIVIAAGIFAVAWNTRKFMPNAYLLFIGVAYFYIAFIDLVHTLVYKGMGVFHVADANLPTQLWIAGRYLEAVSLFVAPLFLGKKLRVVPVSTAYFFATALLLISIHSGVFPAAFIEGRGLTPFKVASEYTISLILAAAIIYLRKKGKFFEKPVLNLLIWSIITTIASEMAFTLYQNVYGFFNLLGHYFKIVSFYLIYAALIKTNLKKPYESLINEIDERKKAEEKLREKTEEIDSYFNNSLELFCIADTDGYFRRINKEWEKTLGFRLEEFEGKRFIDFVHPDDMKSTLEAVSRLAAQKEVLGFENRYRSKDGSYRWIEWRSTSSGKLIYAAARDITKRKLSEETLAKSQAEFQAIFYSISDAAVFADTQRRIVMVNPAFSATFGYEFEEAKGRTTEFLYENKEDYEEVGRKRYRVGIEPDHQPFEVQYRRKNGTLFWAESHGVRVKAVDGVVIGFFAIHHDITERKRAEENIEREFRMRTDLLDNIPGCIALILKKNTHEIVASNRLAREIGAVPGQTCFKTCTMRDDNCPFCLAPKLWTTGKSQKIEVEYRGTWYEGIWEPLTEDLYVHYIFDITERKWAEEERLRLKEDLRQSQKMEAIGTLAGGIAHEFNNILGIIIGNTELAIDDVPEWNPAKDCLEEIRAASLRAKDVVRQIMSFARKMPTERKPINIGTIIKGSLKLMRATIPTSIEIRQEVLCDSEMILANPTEINQILLTLCSNSVHAMEEETGILEVKLETVILDDRSAAQYKDLTTGEHVRLTVKDTGTGIDPEIMDRIFDPYFTTKDMGKGLGMGLAIVFGIVKKHDGAIKLMSGVGKGTTAEVLFPITAVRAETEVKESDALPTGTERILFVDDEPSLVKLVKQMLERQGYEVVGKTNSLEALKLFQEESGKFDLIITDMAMPQMAGDQLAKRLIAVRSDIPIILCTGHSDRIDEEKAKELGIKAYTMKPLNKKELNIIVRKVLDEAKGSTQG